MLMGYFSILSNQYIKNEIHKRISIIACFNNCFDVLF